MRRWLRLGILMSVDAVLVVLALQFAILIRFEGLLSVQSIESGGIYAAIFVAVRIALFLFFKLYNRMWRYASIGELFSIAGVMTLGSAIVYLVVNVVNLTPMIPRSVLTLEWLLSICLIGTSRLAWRVTRDRLVRTKCDGEYGGQAKPILIVGAGDAGVLVARELKNHYNGDVRIIGFVDDDPTKHQAKIFGLPVLGGRDCIAQVVAEWGVKEIVIALPSIQGTVIKKIVDICQETEANVKIVPGMYELLEGNVTVNQIRDVQVEDLLGREPVKVDLKSMSQYLTGQVVLVTGAGGSIGSELCRQVMRFSPKKILLLDNCENNVYDIELELKKEHGDDSIHPIVKDVRDRRAIDDVFDLHKPYVVFHAAAHKHVPLMEVNPEEAIKNNVMGTYNVAQAANMYSAKKFVLISTDKAVNPTSVMGASKRCAEMVIQHLDRASSTNYVAVRFGNVLASRGSVIPLFKKQIAEGGPVTVTHPDMVRYFMTIPEAVQLVIQAGALASGGEIFVLDMGDPVRIMDLAATLIRLSGYEVDKDIRIKITGMRPGEKLYEELRTDEEGVNGTEHKRIFVARAGQLNSELLEKAMRDFLDGNLPKNQQETEKWLQEFLPEFHIVRNDNVDLEVRVDELAVGTE